MDVPSPANCPLAPILSILVPGALLVAQNLPPHDLGRSKVCSRGVGTADIAGISVGRHADVAGWRMLTLLLIAGSQTANAQEAA